MTLYRVNPNLQMFCHQCSRARQLQVGRACCDSIGTCGKDSNLQALFDSLEVGILSTSVLLIQFLREDSFISDSFAIPFLNCQAIQLTDASFDPSFAFDHLAALKTVFDSVKNAHYTRGIPFSANTQYINMNWDPDVSSMTTAVATGKSVKPATYVMNKGAIGPLYDLLLFSNRYLASTALRLMRLGNSSAATHSIHANLRVLSDLPQALATEKESHLIRLLHQTSAALRRAFASLEETIDRRFGSTAIDAVTHKDQVVFHVPLIDPTVVLRRNTIVVGGNDFSDLHTVLKLADQNDLDVVTAGGVAVSTSSSLL
ncbi:hypothetical protein GEMRC1_007805 [Eukaryota sp. GEM-RC1]